MPHSALPRERRALVQCAGLACAGIALAAAAWAGAWTDISPGGGGAFTAIGGGPTGVLICGADMSGAYRSLDHGLTWDRIGSDKGIRRSHIASLGFDPVDPQIFHLGTDVGLYHTGDGGASFTRVIDSGYIGAIAHAWTNPRVVYAARDPSFDTLTTAIYRSNDHGVTWAPVSVGFPTGLRVLKLVVSPQDSNTVYLVSGVDLFVSGLEAIYRSTDAGVTWTQMGASLGNLWDLAIDPVTQGTLWATGYVGVSGTVWSGSTYKSLDSGATWTAVAPHTGSIVVRRDQPQTVRVIDTRRNKEEPESGTWESLDGGATWNRKSTMNAWGSGWTTINRAYGNNAYGVPCTLGQDLSLPDAIYWVSWQFPFASFDGGLSFQQLATNEVQPGRWHSRGIDNVGVTGLSISEADPTQVYVSFLDCGVWRSIDGGASWLNANSTLLTGTWLGYGGHTNTVLADPARPGVVWATMSGREDTLWLVRSTQGGLASSWAVANGLPYGYVRGPSLDRSGPANPRTMFVTDDGDVYRSTDDGVSFSKVFECDSCRSTDVDRFDGSVVYAGGECGMWRSLAHGDPGTWAKCSPPEMSGAWIGTPHEEKWEGVQKITHDPSHPGWAYVAVLGVGKGLFRTRDRGATWTKLLTTNYLRDLAVDPIDSRILYAAASREFTSSTTVTSSDGLQRSTDGGATWTSLNDGLAYPYAVRVAVDPANRNRVILGAAGNGFFERFLSGTTVDVEPPSAEGSLALSEAYPNPSRGGVSFSLRLEHATRVRWCVVDVSGRRIAGGTQSFSAGTTTLMWDLTGGAGRPPEGGVYFARFEVDGRVITRRFALVR
jgi:hypothetical protein